ncbi:RHS repeat-associated core domain-containing protein [Enterobacter sp. 22466]|uniref:RHS repeat-associated core domain-containing protein n=1 Tax=Enterobacter sp. 22466 TaxID=3453924 RepID=UPI003F832D6E
MHISLFSHTPSVSVLDNRGLTVRETAYYRHPSAPEVTCERVTRHRYDARGFLTLSADPRLHNVGLANFTYLTDLTGSVLCTHGADNGITVALNDAAGRPFIAVSNISTINDGTGDRNQAVIRTCQYEDAALPGRPLSIIEQVASEAVRITDRFVYAGNTDAEKALNLAGACFCHYDTAGLTQTDSISLTGVPLSVTRRMLKDADNPDVTADWQGTDASTWNNLLAGETYASRTTADATDVVLTTADAKGNQQRVAYDVAGLLSGSWLTVKDGTEQVIVASLTYSAAGQKLREVHGNGVVTTYTYEAETLRLTGIKTERPAGHVSGAKVLQDLRYEYDPVGNVMKISNDAEETRFWRNQKVVPENTYVYDSLYQLVSATGREMANAGQQGSNLPSATVRLPTDSSAFTYYTRTYSYDNAGNLIQTRHSAPATNNSYTINITVSDKSNRGVLSTLTENPSDVDALFTAGGQQTQLQPGQSLGWTPRNELLKVTPVVRDGGTDDNESYRYDGGSQRLLKVSVQKTGNSVQTQRALYLPGLELRTTKAGDTQMESLQVITAGEAGRARVRMLHWERGQPEGIGKNQVRYSYDNQTGSSSLELDGDGNIISMEEYYPYGGTAVWAARSAVEADYKTVRYSGKERDASGLYYYGYRYYQPWAGRWLSADPAGTMDGLNLFRMVRNNPVTLIDSNGLISTGQEARKLVAEAFVHPLHMAVFERISLEENLAMSVREAGIYTISALGEGAAAKGHNILEKTIKPGSLKAAYGDNAESILGQAKSSGFVGRVGQWDASGVKGIYAHNRPGGEDVAYAVSLQNSSANELVNKWIKFKIITPYTGDYDMHDIIKFSHGKGHVPTAESSEERGIKDLINRGVAEVDPSRPFDYTAMNVIRHGPQVNFVPYMWEHEQDKVVNDDGYLGIVANPGPFPVAMVHQGEWTVFGDSKELFNFYKSTNTPLPEHWSQDFVSRGKGIVATPRHAAILDKRRHIHKS